MRFDLKVDKSYGLAKVGTIVAIHHDLDRSVILLELTERNSIGQNHLTYVVGLISDQTYKEQEWYNGYYTDYSERACETYVEYVKARML